MAPTAKTSVCANSSQPLPVSSTVASTTVVMAAANRGPRESTVIIMLPDADRWGMVATCQRVNPRWVRRPQAPRAYRLRSPPGRNRQHAAWSAAALFWKTQTRWYSPAAPLSHPGSRTRGQLSPDLVGNSRRDALAQDAADRGQHVGLARLPRGALRDRAVRGEQQHGRGAADVQPPGQVKTPGGVDLNERDSLARPRHLGAQFPGRPAVGAELGGKLHQSRPLTKRSAQLGGGQHAGGSGWPAGVGRLRSGYF